MLERISHYGNRWAERCCLVLLVAMTTVTFAQVFFRFVVVRSLPWSEEFSRYALVWASFLGASVALKRGLHIGVEAFVGKLVEKRRRQVYQLTLFLMMIFLLFVIIKGLQMASFNMRQSSPAMRIPMGLPYLAIPVGSILMFLHLLNETVSGWRHEARFLGLEKGEAEKRLEAGF